MTKEIDTEYFRKKITDFYQERKQIDPAFTLRAFAHYLQIHPPTLSNIMNGKRAVPFNTALKIAERMNMNQEELDLFLRSLIKTRNKPHKKPLKTNPFKNARLLDEKNFRDIISEADNLVVLDFLSTDFVPKTVHNISLKLGFTEEKTESILKALIKASLVYAKEGAYYRTSEAYHIPDNIESKALARSQLQTLKTASEKLISVPLNQRDYTSINIPCNVANLPEARKEVRKFMRRLYQILSKGSTRQELFSLSVQLFPQTLMAEDVSPEN